MSSEYAAVFQIAVDAVTRDTLADDVYAFESHWADQGGVVVPRTALDGINVTAVAVDDCPP